MVDLVILPIQKLDIVDILHKENLKVIKKDKKFMKNNINKKIPILYNLIILLNFPNTQ